MPKFALKVLCSDEKSCNFVKYTLMKDFKIRKTIETEDFDHIGIANFPSVSEARIFAYNLKQENSRDILDILVANVSG